MRPSTAKHLASKSTRELASPSIARRHPRRMGGSPGSTRPPTGECLEKSVPARVVGRDRLGMPVPARISACLTRTSTDGIKHLSSKSMHAPNFLSSRLSPPEHTPNFLSSGPSPPERAPPTQSSRLLLARGSARASAKMARHPGGTYCPCTPPAAPIGRDRDQGASHAGTTTIPKEPSGRRDRPPRPKAHGENPWGRISTRLSPSWTIARQAGKSLDLLAPSRSHPQTPPLSPAKGFGGETRRTSPLRPHPLVAYSTWSRSGTWTRINRSTRVRSSAESASDVLTCATTRASRPECPTYSSPTL